MVRRLLMVAWFLFMGAAASVNAQPQPQADPQPGVCNLTSTYPVVSVSPTPPRTRGASGPHANAGRRIARPGAARVDE